MFSANENLLLRQEKRRIVNAIEATMTEEALDFGTTVMVMQVSCKAPGCVPLETAIIIVFPKSSKELVPGLPDSCNGGSYKTKILKPMIDVTSDDILDALPPAFKGGRKTMERLCLYARDVMLAQITQLFGEEQEADSDRLSMAEYLKGCLEDYMANGCKAPEEGGAFPVAASEVSRDPNIDVESDRIPKRSDTTKPVFPMTGNLVIKRVVTSDPSKSKSEEQASNRPSIDTVLTGKAPRNHQREIYSALNPSSRSSISNLFNREHAPGIRQAGCPCCDPENISNVVDTMMML
jgi:hypothetical protein